MNDLIFDPDGAL